VWWERAWRLIETLTRGEPARRSTIRRRGHAKSTRWAWEWSTGEASLRTEAIRVWAARTTSAERRVAARGKLARLWEIRRRLLTALLVLRYVVLTLWLLRLLYLTSVSRQ
jgi:hypothetical protein